MATNTVTNWFGNIVSHPAVIVDANSVDDIVAVMKDPLKYPSPVRAVGSNHSTAPCGVADGGTLIRMKMNQILNIGQDSLTVQADAVHIDMAKALEAKNLQFYVNTEIGSLSAGSASCAGTKDASFPGEYRPGWFVCHRRQNGASKRRSSRGDRRCAARPDAASAIQLRPVWNRL